MNEVANEECYHLLFVDDDQDFLHSMELAISSKLDMEHDEYEIETHFIDGPDECLEFLQELVDENEKVAMIISDQQMPDMSGVELLEKAAPITPNAVKMLLTGYASLDSAKYAINNRILDQYVSKPIEDYDNFVTLIDNGIKTFNLTIQRAKAEQETIKYIKELEVSNKKISNMHQAAEKIAYLAQNFKKLDLDEVFDLITNKLPDVFNAKYSSLFIYDPDDDTLKLAQSNYLDEIYTKPVAAQGDTPMMVALRENKVLVVKEIQQDSSLEFLNKECLGASCVIIPFYVGGKNVTGDILGNTVEMKGVLNLGNIMNMPSEEILRYSAELVKNIMGINILNANLYKKTTHLALIDGLSGLYNKHIFSEFLRKAGIYSERHETSFFLAMFDIDDFKKINDTYGHPVGDKVIEQIGSIFQNFARKSDIIARYGGEEFTWIAYGQTQQDVMVGLERIRKSIEECQFPEDIHVTISIGLSKYCPKVEDSVEELVSRADKALYAAKEQGKNRVEINISAP